MSIAAPRTPAVLPESLARELGVADSRALLAKLNAIYRRGGVQTLSEESAPTTREGLATLVRLYRRATGIGLPDAKALARAARRIAARPRPARERVLPPPVPPQDRARYAGLRTAPLPPALAAELGVSGTITLVERLNAHFADRGEPPLPQGSYPTNSQALRRLVTLYRNVFGDRP